MRFCHKDKKNLPSLEGTRLALIQEGVLDESNPLLITNKEQFDKENEYLSRIANEKTGKEGNLYRVEDRSKLRDISKNSDGSVYRGPTFIKYYAFPNKELFDALDDVKKKTSFQLEDVPASKASKETIGKVKKLIEQMGVNIVSLQEYLKGNPDVPSTGINALADTIKGIIAIAEGKEDVALTEEMVHVATSILEQVNPQLITNLIGKISQYKIYNVVLEKYKNNKAYQLPNGKPNIRKIKKEAVDKLIAEMIINMSEGSTEFPELMEKEKRNIIQQMWDAILSAFKSLYAKSEVDLFEETAQTILKGDLGARYYRIKPGVQELFNSNPELANAVYEALGFNNLRKEYSNVIIDQVWKRLASEGITNADSLIGTRETINNKDFNKFWSAVKDVDIQNVIKFFESEKQKALDSYSKYKGEFDPTTGTFTSNDTSFFDNKIKDLNTLLQQKQQAQQLYSQYLDTTQNKFISPNDRVVFGHPTIGKSFLKKQGEDKFITLDDDYANEVNAFVDANRGTETRQEYKGRKPREYNEFMLNLYDRLKLQAQREGKILFVSNTNILKERMSDFDKVITIPKAEFKRRFDERGATYGFEDWKSDIDATVAKVPTNKVITTTGYLADLFRGSKQDIEGFKSFAETAPAEFKGGEGVFFQIEENEKVNSAFNKFKDMNDRMKLVDSNGVEKRHYTYDGEKLEKTVTTLKEKKDLKRTPEEKEIDDQKRLWGSEGHKFLENYITNNLINKDGYALTNPKEIEISTPLKDSVKKSIITFAKELIASYPEGTRFLIESKVANLKVKERIGSTIDFIAFEPITNNKGESDVKIDILDWKFTSFNTENNEDVPWYKQKEWKEQMGEYTKMAYNLGVERNQLRKARMIPFVTNYGYSIKNDKKSPLVAKSVEIGKVDSLKETNLYLLPVPVDFESTGNETIDQFISSLRKLYEKIYISSVTPEEKFAKNLRLDNISKAIRKLQLNLNFFPIYDVAKNFLVDAKETLKEFDNVNYSKISKEELIAKLQKLQEYQKSADKFVNLDDIFLSHISKEDMSPAEKKLLEDFGKVTVATKRMLEEIQAIQQEYVLNIAMKEGIVDEESADEILEAEKQVSAIDKNFLEGSKLAPKIIQLATKMILFTKNLININFAKTANEWEKILIPLEKEARAQGKSAFDMIGKLTERGPRLIKKLDSDFLDRIKKAKKEGNKQFLLDNLNLEEYKKLVDPVIQKGIDELDRTQFSSDEEEDVRIREKRKQNLKNSLDITSESFIGFEDYTFQHFYRKAMIEEGHYSKEYLEMSKSENALKVWNFFTTLNERAKSMGYLDKEGLSFFPLIEATTLQKMTQSGKIFKETKDFFKDMYTINPNEEQLYAKVDDETGELKKIIPKYFTRTNKDVAQLSTDLNKVGLMWIKSLMEYESAKDLEFSLLTMHSVEKHKGSLIIDSNGNIIFDGKNARVNRAENKNAELLQVIIDDYLYGINENLNSMGNALMSTSISKLAKTSEKAEKATVSTKKALKTGDILVRALALGLKPLIGAANWAGTQMQAFINSGGVYRFREFEKNNVKVTLPYGLSLLEKALLNEIIPLSGDSPLEVKQRQIASKKSIPNYLSTWTFTDVMMITNSFGERKLELANALTMIENSMLVNGKIVNIRQYLKAKDREARKGMSFEQRRELENSFQKRVDELKEGSTALINISKIVDNELIIEGVSNEELARFRMSVIDHARNLNGQMSNDDKMGYRRDTIFSSFMMFKGWIPKQLSVRGKAITKNITTGEWEYGRYRAFAKTIVEIGFRNITDLRDVVIGTDKGLAIINRILEEKKQQYYLQTGKELRITEEEFQDLMRSQVTNMLKELFVIVSIIGILAVSKLLAPDDDDDDIDKNRYKYFAKLVNKVSDEILFYVNPASADEMTRGSIIPALGLFSKVGSLLNATRKEVYYTATGDEKEAEKAYPIKYFINLIPVGAQFQNEVLPLIDAELAKEMGVRVSAESRRN